MGLISAAANKSNLGMSQSGAFGTVRGPLAYWRDELIPGRFTSEAPPGNVSFTASADTTNGLVITSHILGGTTGNPRYYWYDPYTYGSDWHVKYWIFPNGAIETGVHLRLQNPNTANQRAVTVWNNVIIGVTANILCGFWSGQDATFNNGQTVSVTPITPITSITVAAGVATVTTPIAHLCVINQIVSITGNANAGLNVGPTVTGVTTFTFTFATGVANGTYLGGQFSYYFSPGQWVEALVIGNQVSCRTWIEGAAVPAYTVGSLPDSAPSGTGSCAIVSAHGADLNTVTYQDLTIVPTG